MQDVPLELVRHFLIEGAEALGAAEVRESVERWKWEGPGVWTGVETAILARNPAVFEAAVRAVRAHGRQVELDYLRSLAPNVEVRWQRPQSVEAVVEDLDGLRAHLLAGG